MAIKDILIHVDSGPTCRARLHLAGELARRHGARLVALYAIGPSPHSELPVSTDVGSLELIRRLREEYSAAVRAAAAQVEAAFRAETERLGIAGNWLVAEGPASAVVVRHARCSDLVILGQIDPAHPPPRGVVPEEVILSAGRPALIVPYAGRFDEVGRRALIAWNASRESARAVGDALPLMAGAEGVTVLTINPTSKAGDDVASAASLREHLAYHGINARVEPETADDISVGDLILSRAADFGADLIVMGAYGHSRAREFFLGGATRDLLKHMTVPVLMAH